MRVRWIALALITAIAGLAGGCATMRPTESRAPGIRAVTVSVQQQLEPVPEAAVEQTPRSLAEIIGNALAGNPELSATGYDAAAARARRAVARGAMLPSVSVQGSYTLHLDEQRLVPARMNGEPGAFSDSIATGDVVLKMPLFAGGKYLNEMRAADLLRQSAEQRMARTRDDLIFNVSSVFWGILAQEKLIGSLEFSRSALENHQKQVGELVTAQKAARVDLLRTEVRLSDVQQKLVREINILAIQRRLLANFMGLGPGEQLPALRGDLGAVPSGDLPMEDGLALAMNRRPDYLAAIREVEAQARRVDVARADFAPRVDLFASYGRRWALDPSTGTGTASRSLAIDAAGNPTLTLTEPFAGRYTYSPTLGPSGLLSQRVTETAAASPKSVEDAGRVGINVDIPVFQGGRTRARVAEERAKLSAAHARLLKLELQIQLEVETAILNRSSALERVQTLGKAIELAQESLAIERQKYELGKGTIVDVLDAQAALLESETNYYRALADVNTAIAQIDLATGGPRQ